jgi:hypothetical protein
MAQKFAALATGIRPSCWYRPPSIKEGRREGRAPVASAARLQKSEQTAVTTGSTRSSGLPCAMVLRLMPSRLPRSSARSSLANLTPASACQDPHDFAVRIGFARLARPTPPSYPRLTLGDDWPQRPLDRGGTAGDNHMFLKNGIKVFSQQDRTAESVIESLANFLFSRPRFLMGHEPRERRRHVALISVSAPAGGSTYNGDDDQPLLLRASGQCLFM